MAVDSGEAGDIDLFRFVVDKSLSLDIYVGSPFFIALIIILVILIGLSVLKSSMLPWRSFEIDETEFGIGDQKVKLKPNSQDEQIAYRIWVELSTRKIGLPIDLEDDVIAEIYDSWYNFFSVTRELIKDIPVSKVKKGSTQKIIRLSIEVLNHGLRPHLTKWQARFRRWYDHQLSDEGSLGAAPQEIQKEFPQYEELAKDMLELNDKLIRYRQRMYELVTGQKDKANLQ